MAAYAAARRRAGRSDRSLHCCRPAGSLPRGTWPARPRRGATRGAGGNTESSRHEMLSALLGGSDVPRRRGDRSLSRRRLSRPPLPPPPPPSRGSPAAVAARRRRRRGGGRSRQRSPAKTRHGCGKRRGFLRDDGRLHSLARRILF